jgi:ERF superfamily
MNKSETLNELAGALATAQGQIKNAAKDALNPFFKSSYADLASVREAINDVFSRNGLAVTQLLGNDAHGVTVETVLLHKSGQWLSGVVSVKAAKDDAQSLGSAVTYARRYSLSAIAGIASETDDDGESAVGRETKPTHKSVAVNLAAIVSKIASAHVEPVVQSGDSLLAIGTVDKVSHKSGSGARGEWHRYGIKLAEVEHWFNTFDTVLGDQANELKGRTVQLAYREAKPFNGSPTYDLIGFEDMPPKNQESADEPEEDEPPF